MDKEKLKKVALLSQLSDAELVMVNSVLTQRQAPKGSTVLKAEDRGENVFILLAGEAKVTMIGPDGKEFLLTILEEGDFFGELSALTGQDRSANVVALADCQLGLITNENFLKLLSDIPALSMSLLVTLAQRLRASSFKLGEFALMDVTERVKQTLRGLSEKSSTSPQRIVHKRPTHMMLASMVGTSREMVTRALSLLEESGELKFDGKSVIFRKD